MNADTFTSKSSKEVKIISVVSIVLLVMIIGSVILMNVSGMALVTRLIIVGFIFLAFLYFFSTSLKKIIIEKDSIVLDKNFGKEKTGLQTVSKTELLAFSNLTTTYGSKGIFGYNGRLMDESKTLVNDRRKMVKIYTPDKNYIISCDEPERLVIEIKKRKELLK
ncbi:MAG: PH domain-containing protein [Ginsengibacter sp.]